MLTQTKALTLIYSQLSPGLLGFGLLSWVVGTGIVEFTIVILLVEVSSDGVSDSKEVLHVNSVTDVGVNVVLEVLEHVHVLVDEVISSYSWEGEGGVIKLPGVEIELWLGTGLLEDSVSDVNGVSPVSWVKSSGVHVHLVVKLLLSFVKVFAWLFKLDEGLVIRAG